ncbi:MAG: hypothetical protein K0S56_546 [Microvirga sp.]|jgi:hypothetical protein|nr:hypothetical protein [Microvirga sp.]
MAKPRTPSAKAKTEGREKINPGRFATRKEPKVDGALGAPPAWLKDHEKNKARVAWALFQTELPWLNQSHRALVEMASNIRGRMMAGEDVGIQAMNLLRQCLGQMGATPADASKITVPDDGEEDPDEALFARH